MFKAILSRLALTAFAAALVACGGGGGGEDTCIGCPVNPGGGTTTSPRTLAVQLSTTSVKTDNSDASEVAVTVLDSSNAPIPDQTVTFSATRGQLSAASAITDSSGVATVSYRSGTVEQVNRTGEVTVRAGSLTRKSTVLVAGSTLTAVPPSTSQLVIGNSVSLRFVVRDAGGTPVPNQALRITVDGTGQATLNGSAGPINATSGADGSVTVVVVGVAAGGATVTAAWLDSDESVTASSSIALSVQGSGSALEVVAVDDDPNTPADETRSPTSGRINSAVTMRVNVPQTISSTAVTQIRFASTIGAWAANGNSTYTRPVTISGSSGTIEEALNLGGTAGVATISMQALGAAGQVLATVNQDVSITAPPSSASKITLQASATTLPTSTAGTPSTAILTATVRDSANNVVGDADVVFKVLNDTGTGATISPVVAQTTSVATTGALGQAESTFTAGQLPTNQAFAISAEVTANGVTHTATLPMAVGGVAGSVTLGRATIIESINSDTAYALPMSVQVTDASGASLQGARVSMSVWPVGYARGDRDQDEKCIAVYRAALVDPLPNFPEFEKNEDDNENLVLDPGEDQDGPGLTPDNKLTPAASSAGAVAATVTTDQNGLATFQYVYLKNYADWLRVRIRATVEVQGTEKQTELNFTLPHSVEDEDPCVLPPSPFN